jgi:hypothetical protein
VKKVTQEMREAEPFRWCIYCDADCEQSSPEHADDCSSVTGLYPVIEQDMTPRCPKCGYTAGMSCSQCGHDFSLGEFYVLRDLTTGEVTLPTENSVSEPVCVGCGALAAPDEGDER